MSNKKVLAAFLATTVAVAGGSAWAAADGAASAPSKDTAAQTATQKDYSQLSADASRGYQDLTMARLAIYDGKIDQAKKYVGEASASFDKAKTDDSIFLKSEGELMTPQQAAAKTQSKTAGDQTKMADAPAPKTDETTSGKAVAGPVRWLPVDGAISLNEDYSMVPAKKQAVADANKSLAKGDKKSALGKLKLAGVDTSVVIEVVPLDATLSDVKQAAQMIDAGKYYEGSQMLRKVQMSARYNILNLIDMPKASHDAASKSAPATH